VTGQERWKERLSELAGEKATTRAGRRPLHSPA
jgi:hypothetical protein